MHINCIAQNSQQLLVQKRFAVADSILIDSLSILPNTFRVNELDSTQYSLSTNGILSFKQKPSLDSISVSYARIGINLSKRYFHKNLAEINQTFGHNSNYTLQSNGSSDKLFEYGEIDYGGSLARSLSFGNAQDVVLNSQFNLQMNGTLADGIELKAAVTDNNVPFQPQGNTQRLQEFDRIYINLSKKKANLLLGDYDMQRPEGYFMQFYKRVQGAYFSNAQQYGKQVKHTYAAGASLAKGKFVRQPMQVQEGNQGPYKLIGPNGETFFIVLANSEKVIVDGIVLQRGEEFDYIIDYNTAEITFMPRMMVNKDRRVIVEYEFNDRNYLNSLFYTSHQVEVGKHWQFSANMYSNQDARNQPFQQELDSTQKSILASVGDNISQAVSITAVRDSSLGAKVFYLIKDTTVAGITYDSIFVYTAEQNTSAYSVNFSFVGPGKGNYIIDRNTANGRVYKWIAPVDGVLMGEYMPYTQLVSPKRLQMFTAGAKYTLDSNTSVAIELGLSNNDPNLFSRIDNEKHLGTAAKFTAQHNRTLSKKHALQLNTTVGYEFVESRFRALERFRTTEFSRDWSLEFEPEFRNEHLPSVRLQLSKAQNASLMYEYAGYIRAGLYNANRQRVQYNQQVKNLKLQAEYNNTQIATTTSEGAFLRPSLMLEYTLPRLGNTLIGTKCSLENSLQRSILGQQLLPQSFAFNVAKFYIQNAASATNKFGMSYFAREDQLPSLNVLRSATLSHNATAFFDISSWKQQTLRANLTYRKLFVHDTALYRNRADNSLLGRLEHTSQFYRGAISTNLLYEFGSGQELRREITYIEVPVGKGDYAWIDYNSDNVQQLNEFELAQFPDQRRFIRVFTPSNQYINVNYSTVNLSLNLSPKAYFKKEDLPRFQKFLTRWTNITNIQLANRSLDNTWQARFLPWYVTSVDTFLLAQNNTIANNLYFNRFSQIWGADYQFQNSSNKNLMTYGVDERSSLEHTLRLRLNINKQLTFLTNARNGNRIFNSQFLEGRNYKLRMNAVEPVLSLLTHQQKNRWQLSAKYDERANAINFGGEYSRAQSLSAEFKHTAANRGTIELKSTYSNIYFEGAGNTSVAFIMLDGLTAGRNYLWSASLDKRIGKGFEISLSYDGRKTGINQVVHTGRASARAIF
ncbi:MAG: hypothetical protein RL660_677 [Bacteroidota bacterium]|jgi:hypothetical protein